MLLFFNFEEYNFSNLLDLKNKFKKIYSNFLNRFSLPDYDVELFCVSKAEIRELNRDYRKKDYPTDVLSFPLEPSSFENTLGSIFFCYLEIKNNNINLIYEFCFLFSHSLLHLIGYEHGEEMFALQENLLEGVVE